MNFFNRAIKNVTRNLTKTVLLVITFFVIGNFVIVGLGVSAASENAKTLTRQKMRAVVSYELDYDAIWQYADSIEDEDERNKFYDNYPRITLEDVQMLLKDDRVKVASALSISQLYSVDGSVDFVHLNNSAEENRGGGSSCWISEEGEQVCYEYVEPDFLVKANYFSNMIEIEDGDIVITDGRFYSNEEIEKRSKVILISEALAEYNGLRVGDSVDFSSYDVNMLSVEAATKNLSYEDVVSSYEIIGIFSHNSPITPDAPNYNYCYPYENPDNMILMPASTLSESTIPVEQAYFDYYAQMQPDYEYYQNPDNRPDYGQENRIYINDVALLLSDPMDVDQFVEDYSSSLSDFKKISANNEEFLKLAKPLDTLSLYAKFIIAMVVINSVIIISLVTALTLKTREYEIGVLLSVGASKLKVVAQFFVELALVALLGFTLSVASGSIIANKVGATVLEYQLASSDVNERSDYYYYDDYVNIWDTNYTSDVTLDDLVAEYNVSVSPVIIAEIYALGLGIVFVSVIIPSFMIMRYNPRRILMNQN